MSILAARLDRIKPSPTIAVSTKAAELKAAAYGQWASRRNTVETQILEGLQTERFRSAT